MKSATLSHADLAGFIAGLIASGMRVVGPARMGVSPFDHIRYRRITSAGELEWTAGLPANSIKEFFFPPTEVLLRWKQKKGDIQLQEVPTTFAPTVIFGARPCDAASPGILDRVMNWDFRDELWNGRRDATTIVSLACPGEDKSCFCPAVGLGPDSAQGADVLLVPVDGAFHVEVHTAKGDKLVQGSANYFSEARHVQAADKVRAQSRAKVEANLKLAPDKVRGWLEKNFDHGYWAQLALRCQGCGACASVCPTCHCFDIVDELRGVGEGERRRNWDTCQTGKFTLHGSGHNPRNNQNARFRQRVAHKFAIYPSKFDQILCTGCGRCARACPAGMDLPEILRDLERLADTGGAA